MDVIPVALSPVTIKTFFSFPLYIPAKAVFPPPIFLITSFSTTLVTDFGYMPNDIQVNDFAPDPKIVDEDFGSIPESYSTQIPDQAGVVSVDAFT